MKRKTVLELIHVLDYPEKVAQISSAFSSEKRVRCFDLLYDGVAPPSIAEELGISRSALQPYLNDFKEAELVDVEGKKYVFTEKGESVYRILSSMDVLHRDLSMLEEYLREHPDVIPEDVKEEIRRERST